MSMTYICILKENVIGILINIIILKNSPLFILFLRKLYYSKVDPNLVWLEAFRRENNTMLGCPEKTNERGLKYIENYKEMLLLAPSVIQDGNQSHPPVCGTSSACGALGGGFFMGLTRPTQVTFYPLS